MIRRSLLFLMMCPLVSLRGAAALDANKFLVVDSELDYAHTQLNVPSQGTMKNGGASCGLQALFNGWVISRLLRAQGAQRDELVKSLRNIREREKLFGTNADEWGRKVALARTRPLLRAAIEKELGAHLNNCFVRRNDAKANPNDLYPKILEDNTHTLSIRKPANGSLSNDELAKLSLLLNMLRTVAMAVIRNQEKLESGSLRCSLERKNLLKIFREALKKRKDTPAADPTSASAAQEKKHIEEILSGGLRRYFSNFDAFAPDKNKVASVPLQGISWVEQEELHAIAKDLPADTAPVFYVGDDMDCSEPLKNDFRFKLDEFISFKNRLLDPASSAVGIFLVYTGSSARSKDGSALRLNQANSHGHWYCVVANKIGPNTQYIVADSLGNARRLGHRRFLELVDYVHNGNKPLLPAKGSIPVNQCVLVDAEDCVAKRSILVSVSAPDDDYNSNEELTELFNKHPFLLGIVCGAFSVVIYKILSDKFLKAPKILRSGPDIAPDAPSPGNNENNPDEVTQVA